VAHGHHPQRRETISTLRATSESRTLEPHENVCTTFHRGHQPWENFAERLPTNPELIGSVNTGAFAFLELERAIGIETNPN